MLGQTLLLWKVGPKTVLPRHTNLSIPPIHKLAPLHLHLGAGANIAMEGQAQESHTNIQMPLMPNSNRQFTSPRLFS